MKMCGTQQQKDQEFQIGFLKNNPSFQKNQGRLNRRMEKILPGEYYPQNYVMTILTFD